MKKILFRANVLAILSVGLLVAVFAAIGMSFTPVEEEIIVEQNDTITTLTKRRSHTGSGCNTHNANDYAEGIASSVLVNGKSVGEVCLVAQGVSPTTWEPQESKLSWNCNNNKNSHKKTLDWYARVTEDGYYFQGWSNSSKGAITSNDNPFSHEMIMPTDKSQYEDSKTPYQETYYAIFSPVTVVATTEIVNLTSFAEISGTMTLSQVGGDDINDFQDITNISTIGDGKWTVTRGPFDAANGTIKINYTYNPNRTTYKNSTGSLTDEVNFNFGGLKQSPLLFTIRATFPFPTIQAGTAQNLTPVTVSSMASGVATFPVNFADAKSDFKAPVFASTEGAPTTAWTITQWDYADNLVTIHYTFRGDGTNRRNTATLTLAAADGTASNTCTVTAIVPASQVLSATADNLSPLLPNTEYRGAAVFEVQYAATHAVSFAEQPQCAGTWKILNSTYKETDAATGKGTVTVNYSYTTAADFAVRQNSNTLTLTLDGGLASRACTVTANIPDAAVLSATAENLSPILPSTEYPGTAVFEVQCAATHAVSFGESQGAGTWTVLSSAYRITDAATGKATVTVNYTYTTASDYQSRQNSNTLTLTLDGGASKSSCTITADLPAITISEKLNEVLVMTLPDQTQAGKVVFDVMYADGVDDFSLPTATDSKWGITDNMQYASLSPSSGTLTVNYTFDNGGVAGDWTTELTLQAKSGETCVVTLRAIAEAPSNYDASVTTPAGVTTEYEHWAVALDSANLEDGRILRLLRNIDLGTLTANQEITKTMTIDLNGKTLSATLPKANQSLLYLNTAGVILTVTDGRSGGTIKATGNVAGALYAVQVKQGDLIWEKANIEITNTTGTGNNWNHATGIYLANQTSLTMTGGKITSRHTQAAYAGGIYADAGAKVTATGVTIDVEAHSNAYGIYANAAVSTDGVASAAQLNLTNNIVTATTKSAAGAYGVYLKAEQKVITTGEHMGEYAVAANAVITGGSYTAEATTGTAYGIYAVAPVVTANGGAYAASELSVTGATITAKLIGGNTAYGIQASGQTTIIDCKITASTPNGYVVRGLFLNSGKAVVSGSTIEAIGAAPNSQANGIYGIYANASISNGQNLFVDLKAENNTVTATATTGDHAYGVFLNAIQSMPTSGIFAGNEYAAAANAVIRGGSYTAEAYRNTAHGISAVAPVVTAAGGAYAASELSVSDATIVARTKTGTTAYGIQGGGATTVERCRIAATAEKNTTARGIFLQDKAAKVTNCEITATGTTTVYGIYADASIKSGHECFVDLTAENNTVTAEATTGSSAFAVYMMQKQDVVGSGDLAGSYATAARATIIGGTYTAIAKQHYAFAIANITDSNYKIEITADGKAVAPENAFLKIQGATIKAKNSENNHTVCGVAYMGQVEIDDCIIEAESALSSSRGVMLGYGKAVITNSTITAKGASSVYGIYANASVKNGHECYVDLTAENNIVTATTTTGGTAYGVYLEAKQDTPTSGIFAGNEYAAASNAVITGGSYKAEAKTGTAYGICAATPVATAAGGAYAAGELTLTDAEIVARTLGTTTAYGIQGGGATTVERCRITAEAATTTARGIWLEDKVAKVTDCEITATGTTTVSGIYANASVKNGHECFVDLTAENNIVSATATSTTANNDVYGIYLQAFTSLPVSGVFAGNEYAAASKAVITGGTYTATAARNNAYAISSATRAVSDCGGAIAYPEITINGGTFKAVTNTTTARALNSGGKAIVNGGVFTAQSATSNAAGLYIQAGTLEATDAVLNVTAGTTDAYGVYLSREINEGSALTYATQATLNNLQVTVTTGTTSAYGVYGQDGVAKAYTDATFKTNIAIKKGFLTAVKDEEGNPTGEYVIADGKKAIYDIYNAGYKRGEFVDMVRSVTVNGGTYNVTANTGTANTGTAYGIRLPATVVSATAQASASCDLSIKDAVISATAKTSTKAYGIQAGGATTIDNCDITATATSSEVRGILLYDKEATIKNSRIVAEGSANVIGILANADVSNTQKRYVELTSTANTVSATSTTGNDVYALRLIAAKSDYTSSATFYGQEYACASNATIHGGTYTAKSAGSNARAVYADVRSITPAGVDIAYPELIINGGTFSAETGTTTAYAVCAGGHTTIDGGTFTAKAGTTGARGFDVTAGRLVATNARLDVIAATGDARGLHLGRGRNEYSANSYDTEVELNNLTVNVTTTTGNTACGLSTDGSQNSTWTEATFQIYCQTLKCLNADGSVIAGKEEWYDKYNKGYQRGEFVNLPKSVIINGGTYTVVANGTTAYGIYMPNTGVSLTGKVSYSVPLTMRNATISATTETGATAYGVYTSGPTTIDKCDISATSATTAARGIYIYDNKTTLSNSTVTVNATGNDVYGVYAYAQVTGAGWQYKAELQSDNTFINAETITGTGVYALWLHSDAKQATTNDYGRLGKDYAVAASAVLNGGGYKIVAHELIKDKDDKITGPVVYGLGFKEEAIKNDASAAPSCIVNGGKYWGESKAENKFADVQSTALRGKLLINDGYFRNSTNVTPYIREGYSLFDLPTTTKEYEDGYRYFVAPASASGTYVCEVVGQQQYKTLEEALQFVNLNPNTAYTIRMLANYTLPAGDYVLPAKATLLIPYKENQTAVGTTAKRTDNNNSNAVPTAYVTLILASGVNMSVRGVVEASAEQYNAGLPYGRVAATYGHLLLKENTAVTLESGSKLIAWGYVTGKGTIEAKDGATLYEDFSIADWKGGGVTNEMEGNEQKVFPITHYFYQNIEATIVYRPGAVAIGSSSVVTSVATANVDNVYLVGTSANGNVLFMMDKANASQDTYLKKEYDFVKDITYWTMNNGVTLNSIKISASGVNLESKQYVLPITSNFHITLDYGTVSIMQDTYFMPNTVLTIKKEATLSIPSGHTLYIVDSDNWNALYYGGHTTIGGLLPIYSPSWENPKKRGPWSNNTIDYTKMSDAEIFVQGTIEVVGNFYTTEGGANIHSTNEDAGKVIFRKNEPASTSDKLYLCNTNCGKTGLFSYYWNYETYSLTSAKLKNGNDTYMQTASTNVGESFIYVNDQWIKTVDNGCMSTVTDGTGEHLYIHAGDMVEVLDNGDHAYKDKDKATGTRYFINTNATTGQASCVWWEVEPKDNDFYMANQEKYDNYGTYYYYDAASDFWKPKMVTITWKNYDGTTLAVYSDVSYNTSPKYLGATPTRQNTDIAKYAWTGWTDQNDNFYEKNAVLPLALTDMTYTAYFVENKYQYTVTFRNSDGSLIESGLWTVGDMPVCSVTPECAPTESEVFTFRTWQPAVTKVTGPAEYWAQYTPATRYYTVTFLNYDGTVLYQGDFAYDTKPDYQGATPVRESNTAYSYTFSGWDKPFAPVTKDIAYIAQFTAKEREYGDYLDVADWTADGTVLLNMNGYTSPSAKADWTVTADDIYYTKTDRRLDRILELALRQTYQTDDEVLIEARGTDGVIESHRKYKVPHIFDGNATLGAVAEDYSSILFVRSGTLTVAQDANVAAIYVAPGAELRINPGVTLAAGKLVLRTEAFSSAVFTDNGTLLCDNVFYSRIVSDKSQAYPLALPFDADLSNVTFSNGKKALFGTHFGLLTFDTQQRADKGDLNGGNWVGVNPAETAKLNACQGYQLLSASAYWSEYCFPVAYRPDAADVALPVKVAEGTAYKGDWGWNTFCSPYTSRFTCLPVSPEEAVKLSLPNTDNRTYRQEVAATLEPASLFFHQAVADGTLSFGTDAFAFVTAQPSVVARQMPTAVSPVQTQWIRLWYGDEVGQYDETNVYLHPDKFTMDYQTGYDVVKLSKQGTLPFVWSTLPYGDMAFAALPDSVAESGIALTVFAPTAEGMYFSLEENRWLMRLEHLWLLDKEEQVQTDLLRNDYSWLASAGVSRGRFFLYPVLRNATDSNTGWNELHTDDFVAYSMGKTIVVEHLAAGRVLRCYDATGQLISCRNTDAELLSIEVPADGMYFVQVDKEVKKVMVK